MVSITCTFIWALSCCTLLSALQQGADASLSAQRPHVMALFNRYLEQAKASLKDTAGCEDTLGLTFLKNWQGGQSDLCKADCQAQGGGGTAPPPAGQSVFHLRSIPCNKPQAGFHLTALLGSNIQITEPFALLGQPGRDGIPNDNEDRAVPVPGAIRAHCSLCNTAAGWKGVFSDANTRTILTNGTKADPSAELKCEHTVEHPVYFAMRQTIWNQFHHMEDVSNMIFALAALDLPEVQTSGVQVVIADFHAEAPYDEYWRRMSHPYPLKRMRSDPFPPNTCFKQAIFGREGLRSILTHTGVGPAQACRSVLITALSLTLRSLFPDLIGHPALVSTSHSQPPPPAPAPPPVRPGTELTGGQLLGAAGKPGWIPAEFRGHKAVFTAPPTVTKYVVWLSRRHHEALEGKAMNEWQQRRRVRNETHIILELHKQVLNWNAQACFVQGAFKHRRSLLSNTGSSSSHRPHLTSADRHSRRAQDSPHVSHDSMSAARALLAQDTGSDEAYFERMMDQLEGSSEQSWKGLEGRGRRRLQGCRESRVVYRFMVLDLFDIPFPRHLRQIGRASIMIGVHGAGLANVVFMQPGAGALLEIHHNSMGNNHYHNMAWWSNMTYMTTNSYGTSVMLEPVLGALWDLMDKQAKV